MKSTIIVQDLNSLLTKKKRMQTKTIELGEFGETRVRFPTISPEPAYARTKEEDISKRAARILKQVVPEYFSERMQFWNNCTDINFINSFFKERVILSADFKVIYSKKDDTHEREVRRVIGVNIYARLQPCASIDRGERAVIGFTRESIYPKSTPDEPFLRDSLVTVAEALLKNLLLVDAQKVPQKDRYIVNYGYARGYELNCFDPTHERVAALVPEFRKFIDFVLSESGAMYESAVLLKEANHLGAVEDGLNEVEHCTLGPKVLYSAREKIYDAAEDRIAKLRRDVPCGLLPLLANNG